MAELLSLNLLTTIDPPGSCFTQIWGVQATTATTYGLVQGDPDDPNCKPSNFNTASVYSPALCPSSYYGAYSKVATTGAITETVVNCCPTNFFNDAGVFGCVSSFAGSTSSVIYTYSKSEAQSTGTKTFTNGGDRGWNAHSIQVRFQSSDVATSTQTSSTSTSSARLSSSVQSNAAPSEISAGTKAGIGIGAAVGGIGVLALVIWLARRRKLRQTVNTPIITSTQPVPSIPRHEIGSSSSHSTHEDQDTADLVYAKGFKTVLVPPCELEAPRPRVC